MVLVLKLWTPKNIMRLEGDKPVTVAAKPHTLGEIAMAWSPYLLLVLFVLAWGDTDIKHRINQLGDRLIPGSLPTVPGTETQAVRMGDERREDPEARFFVKRPVQSVVREAAVLVGLSLIAFRCHFTSPRSRFQYSKTAPKSCPMPNVPPTDHGDNVSIPPAVHSRTRPAVQK